jgi:hypothetical protein
MYFGSGPRQSTTLLLEKTASIELAVDELWLTCPSPKLRINIPTVCCHPIWTARNLEILDVVGVGQSSSGT